MIMSGITAPSKPNTSPMVDVPFQLTCGPHIVLPLHINYNMLEITAELAEVLQCSPEELNIAVANESSDGCDAALETVNSSLVLAGLDYDNESFQIHVDTPPSFDCRRLSVDSCKSVSLGDLDNDAKSLQTPLDSTQPLSSSPAVEQSSEKMTAVHFRRLVESSNNSVRQSPMK